ncbi:hypothetical protein FACS1894126_5790 [Alphaproteobacteria bacterium]|nr:hypothetical protein FACS1894126_5790 [Alphaproteobacteria bacterium]
MKNILISKSATLKVFFCTAAFVSLYANVSAMNNNTQSTHEHIGRVRSEPQI